MRARFLTVGFVALACARESPPPAFTLAPVTPTTTAPPPVTAPPAADAGVDAATRTHRGGVLDLDGARQVSLRASPGLPTAPRAIGSPPARARRLRETGRVADASALARAEAGHGRNRAESLQYDARWPFELAGRELALPRGARRDIPLHFAGGDLTVISESGGRLLLVYAERFVAVVDGPRVEEVVDMEPPDLPLSEDERSFSSVHQAVYDEGVLFVCRGYNASIRARKGIVVAVDAASGELRWRSDALVCGGVLARIDDYVVTGYGAWDRPYALKLLRRSDGGTAQSLALDGAAMEFTVSGDTLVAATYKDRVNYRLEP